MMLPKTNCLGPPIAWIQNQLLSVLFDAVRKFCKVATMNQ